ncbi:MAG: ABC transporter ATP-binding protein [Nitrospira sp.]|nr:MAG: ABC transporter ATP-binding protein [Nitrospira sp.]
MSYRVVVDGVGKRFQRYHAGRPWTLQEVIQGGFRRIKSVETFWALRDVHLSVPSGHMVGIIGHNGSGKSTLLQVMGKVMLPDEGRVQTQGRIGALLSLSAGFHSELTGRDNVYISGVINGLTRREVADRFDSIVAFAELEQFIDMPLRTYSSGMQMRLGFAVSTHVRPDILLVDEVLAVGDLAFQRKCLDRIKQFKAEGATIILVSHDTSMIGELCDEALWLLRGRVMAQGKAGDVVNQYLRDTETRRRTPTSHPILHTHTGVELRLHENRIGSLELEITKVSVAGLDDLPTSEVEVGDPLRIEVFYRAKTPVPSPILQVRIRRYDGAICYEANTESSGVAIPPAQGEGQIALTLEELDLPPGWYFVDVSFHEASWSYAYDGHFSAYPLCVRPTSRPRSMPRLHQHWDIGGKKSRAGTSTGGGGR